MKMYEFFLYISEDSKKKCVLFSFLNFIEVHNFLGVIKNQFFLQTSFFHDSKYFFNILSILKILCLPKFSKSKIFQLSKPITFFGKVENQNFIGSFFKKLSLLRGVRQANPKNKLDEEIQKKNKENHFCIRFTLLRIFLHKNKIWSHVGES